MKSTKFFAELKRRNVYRAGVIYGMVSWLLVQIATQVFPFFEIPNWIIRLIVVVLISGFPIALALAWAFEFTPQGIMKTEDVPIAQSIRRSTGHKLNLVIIGVLLAIISLLIFEGSFRFLAPRVREKSIAVLPFENLSTQTENAFFADGLQDDLLTNLARIKDLKVISRTSVMKYRDTAARNISEIAQALGVANVLEGSVRRVGDRVAVNVQLVDALHDQNLWANKYDRTLADSLGIEGELATEIASALRARLTPEEKIRVAQKPTENADAYELYLRALPYEQGPDTLLQDYQRAEQLYGKAIALDPNFALAHAHLASTCAEIYHFHDPLDSWKTKARHEAEVALRLQPNLSEAHFARGQCLYWMDGDYEGALDELNIAQQLAPNDTNVAVLIAAIRRRQGRWQDSLNAYQNIEKIDPQNPNVVRNLVFTNTAMRRWPEAARAVARLRTMAPDSVVAKIQTGYVDFWWKGKTTVLKTQLAQIPAGNDPDGVATSCRWEVAMIDRDFVKAEAVLRSTPLEAVDYLNGGATPKVFLAACIDLARGNSASAQKEFEMARAAFENNVRETPAIAERHANLGLLYAFMGRKDDAIREGQRAVELKPESKDAYDGSLMQAYLALIYARVGAADLALPLIDRLLHMPGPVDSADYSITVNDLKFRWEWEPIRRDPRFQKLMATAPNESTL